MTLTASNRISLIREIAERMRSADWSMIELMLHQFGCPTVEAWQGHAFDYVIAMIRDAKDDTLLAMGRHLGHDLAEQPTVKMSGFWKQGQFRLFISHLAQYKKEAAELQEWLSLKDISSFVAHNDIEATKEWQDEIVAGLGSCHAMVALLREGFHKSDWTDQELGFAMGRGILIITVRLGQDPYGFIGKFQAVPWDQQHLNPLAQKIVDILFNHEKTAKAMAEILILDIEKSNSWERSKYLADKLPALGYWDESLSQRCLNAIETNSYIKTSRYIKDPIHARIRRFEES